MLPRMSAPDPRPASTPLTTVDDLVRRILPFGPVRLVMFGSRARDGGRPDSDFDLAIIHPRGAALKPDIRRALVGIGVPVDVLVFTPEQWDAWIRDPRSLAAGIERDGRVLFDAA